MATEKAKAETEAAPVGPKRQRRTADKLFVATPVAARPGQETAKAAVAAIRRRSQVRHGEEGRGARHEEGACAWPVQNVQ